MFSQGWTRLSEQPFRGGTRARRHAHASIQNNSGLGPKRPTDCARPSLDMGPLFTGTFELIPSAIDQNPCAHWRNPMDMIRQG